MKKETKEKGRENTGIHLSASCLWTQRDQPPLTAVTVMEVAPQPVS